MKLIGANILVFEKGDLVITNEGRGTVIKDFYFNRQKTVYNPLEHKVAVELEFPTNLGDLIVEEAAFDLVYLEMPRKPADKGVSKSN